jgi:hypothetical protein
MCPLCISAAALVATGGISTAGIGALIALVVRTRKENDHADASDHDA